MNQMINFCECGKVKGHKDKCLSVRTDKKKKIPKYSGPSKRAYGGYEKE